MNISNYNLKSKLYDNYRQDTPGWDKIKDIINITTGDTILDLGCGSGAFIDKLSIFKSSLIHGIDPSSDMINIAKNKVSYNNVLLECNYVNNLPSNSYDCVFSAQVIQNLTLDTSIVKQVRYSFYREIFRILKPGGQLIITTRNSDPNYSNLYWYCDPKILPKSISDMIKFVPHHLHIELSENGFTNIITETSSDLIYKSNAYKNKDLFLNDGWYEADSFWSHVKRNDELNNFESNLKILEKTGKLDKYICNRDLMREGKGHICIISAYKS